MLEELDRYVFDRMDPNTNCLDNLAAKIWGPVQSGHQGVTPQVAGLEYGLEGAESGSECGIK